MKMIIIIVLIAAALSYVVYYITKPPAADPENDVAYLAPSSPEITPIYNNAATSRQRG